MGLLGEWKMNGQISKRLHKLFATWHVGYGLMLVGVALFLLSACSFISTPSPVDYTGTASAIGTEFAPTATEEPTSILIDGEAPSRSDISADLFHGYLIPGITCGIQDYRITLLKGLDGNMYLFENISGSTDIKLLNATDLYGYNDTRMLLYNGMMAVYSSSNELTCVHVGITELPACYGVYDDQTYMVMKPFDGTSSTSREKAIKMSCQTDGHVKITELVTPLACLEDSGINITQDTSIGGSCEKNGEVIQTWTPSEPFLWPPQRPVEGAVFVTEIPFHVPGTDEPGYVIDETWMYNNGPSSPNSLHLTMFLYGDANQSATVSITQGQIYPTQDKSGTKWYVTNVNQRMFVWKK